MKNCGVARRATDFENWRGGRVFGLPCRAGDFARRKLCGIAPARVVCCGSRFVGAACMRPANLPPPHVYGIIDAIPGVCRGGIHAARKTVRSFGVAGAAWRLLCLVGRGLDPAAHYFLKFQCSAGEIARPTMRWKQATSFFIRPTPQASALDRAGHEALLEVLLHEGVDDEHRRGGHDDGTELDGLGQLFSSAYPPEIMLACEAEVSLAIRMLRSTSGSGARPSPVM